jgi:hypothetical protein
MRMTEFGFAAKSSRLSKLQVGAGAGGKLMLRSADFGMKAVGVMAAVSSASFAAYMINTDHSRPSFPGGEHLMIFAQPLRTRGSDAPFVASLPAPKTQAPAQQQAAADIDYTPVGSIGEANNAPSQRSVIMKPPAEGPVIPGFRLRSVRNGIASLDGPDGIVEAAPGAVIKRAGRVVAIELRSGRWTVVTSDGTIVEQTPSTPR